MLVALLAVVMPVARALAECAWVLWSRSPLVKEWWQVSAHATQAECWQQITAKTFVHAENSWAATLGWVFQTQSYERWHGQWRPNGVEVPVTDGAWELKCLPQGME